MAVTDEATQTQGERFLTDLIDRARLEHFAKPFVFVGGFDDALEGSPQADLTILGVPGVPTQEAIEMLCTKVNSSCIFVRDSGNESVLA